MEFLLRSLAFSSFTVFPMALVRGRLKWLNKITFTACCAQVLAAGVCIGGGETNGWAFFVVIGIGVVPVVGAVLFRMESYIVEPFWTFPVMWFSAWLMLFNALASKADVIIRALGG
ncbi:hypothetical protein V7714_00020 [Chitinimonas sp. JJ19]